MKPEEAAYIAGFFDGEGSVSLTTRNVCPRVQVTITQNETEPLEWIKQRVGGNIYPVGERCHVLMLSKAEAIVSFLKLIQPFVLRRAEKLAIALAIAEATSNHASKANVKNALLRFRLAELFMEVP
jgi:hypothetical protein